PRAHRTRSTRQTPMRADDSVTARLGVRVQVMHDLVFTLALVQVAEYSNPDERQAAAASRALYARRKRVKQHVTFRHPFTPSPRVYRTRSTCQTLHSCEGLSSR